MSQKRSMPTKKAPPTAENAPVPADQAAGYQETSNVEEKFGWEYHRLPMMVAAILTFAFYAFVWLVFGRNP